MRRTFWLALLAVTIAAGIGAASADATGTGPVRVNASNTTGVFNNFAMVVRKRSGTTANLSCNSLTLPMSLTANGAVTVPASTLRPDNCILTGLFATLTQPLAWTGAIRHLDDRSGAVSSFTLDLTVPSRAFHLFIGGCEFDLSGTTLGTYPTTPAHNTLVSVPQFGFPASLLANPYTLTVGNTTAVCVLLNIANGDTAAFQSPTTLVPAITAAAL